MALYLALFLKYVVIWNCDNSHKIKKKQEAPEVLKISPIAGKSYNNYTLKVTCSLQWLNFQPINIFIENFY